MIAQQIARKASGKRHLFDLTVTFLYVIPNCLSRLSLNEGGPVSPLFYPNPKTHRFIRWVYVYAVGLFKSESRQLYAGGSVLSKDLCCWSCLAPFSGRGLFRHPQFIAGLVQHLFFCK